MTTATPARRAEPAPPARRRTPAGLVREFGSFAVIGVASTLAYLVIYLLLREGLRAQAANAIALLVTAVANTAANRRLTFGLRGRQRLGAPAGRGARRVRRGPRASPAARWRCCP